MAKENIHAIRRKRIRAKRKNQLLYWGIAVAVALAIYIPIRVFLFKPYLVATNSMANTLKKGDVVLTKVVNDPRFLEIGDIVVFTYPPEPSQYRFGRIAAIGPAHIQIYNKRLFVNREEVSPAPQVWFSDPELDDEPNSLRDNFGPFTLSPGHLFILGDNRDLANDSRNWGELPPDNVLGKPMFIYFRWKPDPRAPEVNGPLDLLNAFFYNLFNIPNRADLSRIGGVE